MIHLPSKALVIATAIEQTDGINLGHEVQNKVEAFKKGFDFCAQHVKPIYVYCINIDKLDVSNVTAFLANDKAIKENVEKYGYKLTLKQFEEQINVSSINLDLYYIKIMTDDTEN